MVFVRLGAAVLLWAVLMALGMMLLTFLPVREGSAAFQFIGGVPIILAVVFIPLALWVAFRRSAVQTPDINPVHLLRRGDDEGRLG